MTTRYQDLKILQNRDLTLMAKSMLPPCDPTNYIVPPFAASIARPSFSSGEGDTADIPGVVLPSFTSSSSASFALNILLEAGIYCHSIVLKVSLNHELYFT